MIKEERAAQGFLRKRFQSRTKGCVQALQMSIVKMVLLNKSRNHKTKTVFHFSHLT